MTQAGRYTYCLLPGLDGTGDLFEPLIREMGNENAVRVVSYPVAQVLSLDEMVACAAAQLPKNEPLILVAESMSGPIVVKLLAANVLDLKIKGVVFCATFVRSPLPVLAWMTKFLPLELFVQLPIPAIILRGFALGVDAPRELVLKLQAALAKVTPSVIASRIRILRDLNEVTTLRKISVPCCYLQATRDRLVWSRYAKDFKENIPEVRFKRIDGPHLLLQTRPKECLRAMREFEAYLPVT